PLSASISGRVLPFLLISVSLAGCQQETREHAAALTGGNPAAGRHCIEHYGCASCHTIPGIPGADALVGPPLDRIAKRVYIAGVLQNTPSNMVQWLLNPPGVDPKTAMPNLR